MIRLAHETRWPTKRTKFTKEGRLSLRLFVSSAAFVGPLNRCISPSEYPASRNQAFRRRRPSPARPRTEAPSRAAVEPASGTLLTNAMLVVIFKLLPVV